MYASHSSVLTKLKGLAHTVCARTYFTVNQAFAALRPLYFAVHPDLFAQHPEIRNTNEKSLQILNGYLDDLYKRQQSMPGPSYSSLNTAEVKFYMKRNKQQQMQSSNGIDPISDRLRFRSVSFQLKETDPYGAVRSVLEKCSLSTDHLPKNTKHARRMSDFEQPDLNNEWLNIFLRKDRKWKRQMGIVEAINELSPEIKRMTQNHQDILKVVDAEISVLKQMLGVEAIIWSADWNLTALNGCLTGLRRLVDQIGLVQARMWLLGVTIKFATTGTCLSCDGVVILSADDVPDDWLRLIRSAQSLKRLTDTVANLELKASSLLGGASIIAQSDSSLLHYYQNLIAFLDRVGTSLTTSGRPIVEGLGVRVLIAAPTGSLFMTDDGVIAIPCTTTCETVRLFLRQHAHVARNCETLHWKLLDETLATKEACERLLCLGGPIVWERTLSLHAVLDCLNRLEARFSDRQRQDVWSGLRIRLTASRHYSVANDGCLNVPVTWLE